MLCGTPRVHLPPLPTNLRPALPSPTSLLALATPLSHTLSRLITLIYSNNTILTSTWWLRSWYVWPPLPHPHQCPALLHPAVIAVSAELSSVHPVLGLCHWPHTPHTSVKIQSISYTDSEPSIIWVTCDDVHIIKILGLHFASLASLGWGHSQGNLFL